MTILMTGGDRPLGGTELSVECDCPAKTCQPERNEGCYCWRSGAYIPHGEFSSAVSEDGKHG